jgi:hypothetical protein
MDGHLKAFSLLTKAKLKPHVIINPEIKRETRSEKRSRVWELVLFHLMST